MRKNNFKKIFNIFEDGFFNDSFFSTNRMSFNTSNFLLDDESDFPNDNDSNFHKTEENIETDSHIVKKEIWKSIDGTQKFERTSMQSKKTTKELAKPSKEELQKLLDKAIENQEFEKAIELRDKLKT